ncbi:PASTA domain-containing protein [Planctomycetota bacterium]
MSKLSCCTVLVLVLTMFASASDMTTRTFLHQVIAGGLAVEETGATEINAEETQDDQTEAVTETNPSNDRQYVVVDPTAQEKAPVGKGLKAVELKELIDIDKTKLVDVTGMAQSDAVDVINKAGLKVKQITFDYSDTIPAGCIIKQDPESGEFDKGSSVTLVVAQTEIAIQPYPIQIEEISGDVQKWGQLIVHRPFDIELRERIQNVPLFVIAHEGWHHVTIEARAQSIAENLSVAWDFMNEGGYLEVAANDWIMPDDAGKWRLNGPFAPDYTEGTGKPYPAIYVQHEKLGNKPLKIMTVYPEDAAFFGQPVDEEGIPSLFNEKELAEYLISLIKAHHLLFSMKSAQIERYDRLELSKTREGEIFKEICLRAIEAAEQPTASELKGALARIAMTQRYRLMTLAYNAPRDWRLRN